MSQQDSEARRAEKENPNKLVDVEEPPEWATLWLKEMRRTDREPPNGLKLAAEHGLVPKRLVGYKLPVETGQSHTRAHAPDIRNREDGTGACQPPFGDCHRIINLAIVKTHRDPCDKRQCKPYFDALRRAGVEYVD